MASSRHQETSRLIETASLLLGQALATISEAEKSCTNYQIASDLVDTKAKIRRDIQSLGDTQSKLKNLQKKPALCELEPC